MGIDLTQRFYLLPRKSAQHMGDPHFFLTDYPEIALAAQLMIQQQGSGDGIFDSHYAKQGGSSFKSFEKIVKCLTLHRFGLPAEFAEIGSRGCVVKTAANPLYSDTQR